MNKKGLDMEQSILTINDGNTNGFLVLSLGDTNKVQDFIEADTHIEVVVGDGIVKNKITIFSDDFLDTRNDSLIFRGLNHTEYSSFIETIAQPNKDLENTWSFGDTDILKTFIKKIRK